MQSSTRVALPAGWFQIGWGYEIAAGEAKPVHFFGEDLVLCRFESGEIGLFDAICPHMGAHIGFGGKTVGEHLACPYHGWQFDQSGCNVLIPYSAKVSRASSLRRWNVVELGGSILLAWFSPDGAPPAYEAPRVTDMPGLGESAFYTVGPETTRRYAGITMQVDFVTENTVDMSHFRFVHETPDFASIVNLDPVDHRFNVRFSMPMKIFSPDGGGEIVDAVTEVTNWGLGLLLAQFPDGATLIQAQTPVDDSTCDVMMTTILPRDGSSSPAPVGSQLGRFKMACRQVENDMQIWAHRRANAQAHLVAEEISGFKVFAKWRRQFYTATTASPSPTGAELSGETVEAAS